MTNSPKTVYRTEIIQVYAERLCEERLADGTTETLDFRKFTVEETRCTGFVAYKFVCRSSQDRGCVLLADVYVDERGKEHVSIVTLEIDGEEYYVLYDEPRPIDDNDEL